LTADELERGALKDGTASCAYLELNESRNGGNITLSAKGEHMVRKKE